MADTPCPVLTYDRIDANRRRTRWLLVSFALMLLPVVSAITVYVMPWIMLFGVAGYQLLLTPSSPPPIVDASWAWKVQVAMLVLALIITLIALTSATLFLIWRYGSRAVLRIAQATPLDREKDREIVRVIENLCIGAGLPLPSLYIIESPAPNAFAIGRDPEHAALVITRGLVTLLDRRELDGVIAHELSHIGNHDIGLSTILAALVGTVNIPFGIFGAICRGIFKLPLGYRIVAGMFGLQFVLVIGAFYLDGLLELMDPSEWTDFPPWLRWWGLHAMLAPAYAAFVAPVLALVVRQAVSREREFLADADAVLLTRDPEGLALALVKVTTAQGRRLRVGEGSIHLYFTDPRADSVIHRLFPSHPPAERRIELLARMGSGISVANLRRAEAAAAEAATEMASVPDTVETHAPPQTPPTAAMSANERSADAAPSDDFARKPAGTTPLYEQPDGWSRVLQQLSTEADVKPIGRQGEFIRVLANGLTGYVARSASLPAIVRFNAKGLS
jgi:heat shock protein HtpX